MSLLTFTPVSEAYGSPQYSEYSDVYEGAPLKDAVEASIEVGVKESARGACPHCQHTDLAQVPPQAPSQAPLKIVVDALMYEWETMHSMLSSVFIPYNTIILICMVYLIFKRVRM